MKANAAPAQANSVDVQIHHFTHLDLCVRLRDIFAKYSGCLLCDLLQWDETTLPYLHSSSSVVEIVFRPLCGLGARATRKQLHLQDFKVQRRYSGRE